MLILYHLLEALLLLILLGIVTFSLILQIVNFNYRVDQKKRDLEK